MIGPLRANALLCLFIEGIQEDDVDPEDLQPFPTLKRVFESVDIHTGFNIEVKYPMEKAVGFPT